MKLTDPLPWHLVPVGAQVLLYDDDVPRTVLDSGPYWFGGLWYTLIEGELDTRLFRPDDTVRMVILEETDAVASLQAAGLTAEVIETREQ